ncbi:MAG: M14 metallopeptidase family protein [Acidobacteriota bacterium]|nr:M14 metallopeptidase family protein [Acidobacteriota bacterium]
MRSPSLPCCVFAIVLCLGLESTATGQAIRTPQDFLGHRVGADYELARWPQILDYFREVAAASDRVNVLNMGVSSEGQEMIYAEISAPSTIVRVEDHRRNQHLLSDPRIALDETRADVLTGSSKVVILVNCALHASEIASTQMSLELLWELATSSSEEILEILEQTVVLLVPSANPDGLNIVADWYQSTRGKPWEGRGLPWLYQKYAGHDNNRDWFMLNLVETRNETELLYDVWRPTIVWDVHQMGNRTARLFVPPFHDPKNQNVPPLIDQTLLIIGGQMAQRLSREGRTGVIHGAIYDNWWAGGFRTGVYRHNMVGILTEAASVNVASPIFQRKSELTGTRRGLTSYQMTTNFPEPWPGGWWRLRDIVDYELSIAKSLFTYAARYHATLQDNYRHMAAEAVRKGTEEPPFAWLVPVGQRDPGSAAWMLDLLDRTGVEIHRADEPFVADGAEYAAGTWILYCAQPYRAHLMDMMERQIYPDRELYPGGPAEPPYDMAGWTLPLQMGVRRVAVSAPFEAAATLAEQIEPPQGEIRGSGSVLVVPAGRNDDYRLLNRLSKAGIDYRLYSGADGWPLGNGSVALAGSIVVEDAAALRRADVLDGVSTDLVAVSRVPARVASSLLPARVPRIGVYQPWGGSMDEGWTRYVLDRFEYEYSTVHNAEIVAGSLDERYDVLVIPSVQPAQILKGMPIDSTAPAYAGGIGPAGVVALQRFTTVGGTIVFIDQSTNLALEEFNLPLDNIVQGKPTEEFYSPGSVLRVALDTGHPLAWGLPEWVSGYFARSQAFAQHPKPDPEDLGAEPGRSPVERFPATIVGRYADTQLLESGWIRGAELIRDKPALAEIDYNDGSLILLGFGVQRRAQPHGTFRLLFNAMQSATIGEAPTP